MRRVKLGLGHGVDQSAIDAAVGGAATAGGLAFILGAELAKHLLGPGLGARQCGRAASRITPVRAASSKLMSTDTGPGGQ